MFITQQTFLLLISLFLWNHVTAYVSDEIKSNEKLLSNNHHLHNDSPYWEHVLREIIFKTISPPPLGNNELYKRILKAPFYRGPFTIVSNNDSTVVLSRGDVHFLPRNRWILCEEGCANCDECLSQKNPTAKWVLRRIKRLRPFSEPRYDLQISIIPQIHESFHMRNLGLQSFVYVITETNGTIDSEEELKHFNGDGVFHENNPTKQSDQSQGQIRRRVSERYDLILNRTLENNNGNDGGNKSVGKKRHDTSVVSYNRPKKNSQGYALSEIPEITQSAIADNDSLEFSNNSASFGSRLILGTDHNGRKYLVQVVPADIEEDFGNIANDTLTSFHGRAPNSSVRFGRAIADSTAQSPYENILRRVMYSLNNHRQFIENFVLPNNRKLANFSSNLKSGTTVAGTIEPPSSPVTIEKHSTVNDFTSLIKDYETRNFEDSTTSNRRMIGKTFDKASDSPHRSRPRYEIGRRDLALQRTNVFQGGKEIAADDNSNFNLKHNSSSFMGLLPMALVRNATKSSGKVSINMLNIASMNETVEQKSEDSSKNKEVTKKSLPRLNQRGSINSTSVKRKTMKNMSEFSK